MNAPALEMGVRIVPLWANVLPGLVFGSQSEPRDRETAGDGIGVRTDMAAVTVSI